MFNNNDSAILEGLKAEKATLVNEYRYCDRDGQKIIEVKNKLDAVIARIKEIEAYMVNGR